MSSQENPVVPTPPPAPQAAVNFSDLPLVTNPVSSVTIGVDPEILALLNGVSEQQLTSYVQTLENFGTRNTFSETQSNDIGIGAARRWIHDEFLRVNSGALQVGYDDFVANIDGLATNQRNVVATLPGIGDHQGAIVLMAHYDSRHVDANDGRSMAPGADDNASGVAILLELARLLSTRPWNQTIIFVAFAAEEQGTFGSRHFVQNMMLDGHTLEAAIDNDIVGGRTGIPQSIRIFSPGPDTTNSRQLARFLQLIGRLYTPGFGVTLIDGLDREGRFSDHREFINAGIPGVRLTESEEDRNAQHGSNDTWEKLDFNYLRQVAQLNLAAAANMAGAPAPPQAPTVAPMADPGGYILTWPPNPETVGYAISFRPLGSQEYPPLRYVSAAEAGNVAYTDLAPQTVYGVSLAAVSADGRVSAFSPEVIVGPNE
ncbi:MAG: M20/M25/M40 family metallo-hydrolase [Chloroflexota bacterium]|nr:MAG: M20/M25/M40 family metallo-hydrolase [Chloroflexota bacterium]